MIAPMATEIDNYRRMFRDLYGQVDEVLDGMDTEALLFKPFETSPWKGPSGSVGWILAHAVSSTVYLMRQAEYAAAKIPWDGVAGDQGADEFNAANHDTAVMQARAKRTLAMVNAILDGLTPVDLDAERPHPRRPERQLATRWCITHAIDHLSQHIGHAQLTRQISALV